MLSELLQMLLAVHQDRQHGLVMPAARLVEYRGEHTHEPIGGLGEPLDILCESTDRSTTTTRKGTRPEPTQMRLSDTQLGGGTTANRGCSTDGCPDLMLSGENRSP